jgi:uncharacterized membrane protein YphA (DoxX/SURF4 family)
VSRARGPAPRGRSAKPAGRPSSTADSSARLAARSPGPGKPQPAAAGRIVRPGQIAQVAGDWAPALARVLLGLVLAWFGYHELVRPGLWTGYVPVVSATSDLAVVLVLVHGWVLLLLAVALVAGIVPRAAAAVAAALLLEIVISLAATGGLSDLTLRDVGVLGLAICLIGIPSQRLTLRR